MSSGRGAVLQDEGEGGCLAGRRRESHSGFPRPEAGWRAAGVTSETPSPRPECSCVRGQQQRWQ